MTKFKDVAGLYLGCPLKLPDGSIQKLYGIIEDEKGVWFQFAPKLCYTLLMKYALPILRPLSSMTEDEKSLLELNLFQVNNLDNAGEIMWTFDQTKILLSKHFDLFGLIESGEAIATPADYEAQSNQKK